MDSSECSIPLCPCSLPPSAARIELENRGFCKSPVVRDKEWWRAMFERMRKDGLGTTLSQEQFILKELELA